MTADQIIALCASVGACLSALATFMTVREIAKQRRDSCLPDIALTETSVFCRSNLDKMPEGEAPSPAGEVLVPFFWTSDDSDRQQKRELSFALPITNVGLGTAKDLKLSWSYPVGPIVDALNEWAQHLSDAIHLDYNPANEALSFKHGTEIQWALFWRNIKTADIDYVLPLSTHPQPSHVMIPAPFILLSGVYFYLLVRDGSGKDRIPAELGIDKLQLDLTYKDIANRRIRSSYVVRLETFAITANGADGVLAPEKLGRPMIHGKDDAKGRKLMRDVFRKLTFGLLRNPSLPQ